MINYGFWMDVRGTHSWTNPSTCASCRPGAKSKAKVKSAAAPAAPTPQDVRRCWLVYWYEDESKWTGGWFQHESVFLGFGYPKYKTRGLVCDFNDVITMLWWSPMVIVFRLLFIRFENAKQRLGQWLWPILHWYFGWQIWLDKEQTNWKKH